MIEKFCRNYDVLSEATGVSRFELKAIHRATRSTPECPFIGRSGAYPSAIKAWKKNNPDFVPSKQWARKTKRIKQRGKTRDQPVLAYGILRELPLMNALHKPSPGLPVLLADQSG